MVWDSRCTRPTAAFIGTGVTSADQSVSLSHQKSLESTDTMQVCGKFGTNGASSKEQYTFTGHGSVETFLL